MAEFTKRERGQLRRLANEIYEAEAHALLEELESSFAQWRAGEVLSSELLSETDSPGLQTRFLDPVPSVICGSSGDLKGHRPLRLALHDLRPLDDLVPTKDVFDLQSHQIDAAGLAVDRRVEQREIARGVVQLEDDADRVDRG